MIERGVATPPWLARGIEALRAQIGTQGAPAHVEQAVLHAFERHHGKPVRRAAPHAWLRRVPRWTAIGVALPICALLVAWWVFTTQREVSLARTLNAGEVATPFYALADDVGRAGAVSRARWSGEQVVRVEVPRVLLTEFGLPVDIDRLDQPIAADVLLDRGGQPLALRFVHEAAYRPAR